MSLVPVIHLRFGRDGNAIVFQLEGWAQPEAGFAWAVDTAASLFMTLPDGEGDAFLELALSPYVEPHNHPRRLSVGVNGIPVGEDWLMGEGTVAYKIPAKAVGAHGSLLVELQYDQSPSPLELGLRDDDTRRLAFMLRELRVVRVPPRPVVDATALPPLSIPEPAAPRREAIMAATGLDPRMLTLQFESLGHNCEFGLFQRHLEAEPLGLLRFAGITLDNLLAGLRRGFADVGDDIVVRTLLANNGKHEYMVYDDRYKLGLHSFRTSDEATAAEVHTEHTQRLVFARRQFRRWLTGGERIFVFQRPGQMTRSQALPLLNLLQSFGPNALLYVDQDPRLPSGAVEQVGWGLFHGRLDHMAPAADVGSLDLHAWLSLCANSHRLWTAFRNSLVVT